MLKRLSWEVWLSLGFISLGLIMVGVAWNGAASVDTPEQQIPYILSGGLGGLALVGIGASLLLFIAGKRMVTRLEVKYDQMIEALAGHAAGAPAEPAASNGKAPAVEDGMVVVGRSSFHMADCRLVLGKGDMEALPPDEAQGRGLAPCRVCEPLKALEKPAERSRRR